jgi:hypothetical protein
MITRKNNKEMYKRKKEYYDNQGLMVGMDNPQYDTYHVHYHVLVAVIKVILQIQSLYET